MSKYYCTVVVAALVVMVVSVSIFSSLSSSFYCTGTVRALLQQEWRKGRWGTENTAGSLIHIHIVCIILAYLVFQLFSFLFSKFCFVIVRC